MKRGYSVFAALIVTALTRSEGVAQVSPPLPPPPTTASAEVTACAQAQAVVDSLLANAYARLETARQSNTPADMRAAIDALQTTIRDVRAQLAACANVGAPDPHAGHVMPPAPGAKPATPPSKPTAPAKKPPTSAKPPAVDPHAVTRHSQQAATSRRAW